MQGNAITVEDETRADELEAAIRRRVAHDVQGPRRRSALRRAVARGLAGEGVVLSPARWAGLVAVLTDRLEEPRPPFGPADGTLDGFDVTYR